MWCPQTSSDGVEHPSCSGLIFWSSSVVAVHGPILGDWFPGAIELDRLCAGLCLAAWSGFWR